MTKFGGVKTWEEAENLMMKPKSQFEDYDKKINLS